MAERSDEQVQQLSEILAKYPRPKGVIITMEQTPSIGRIVHFISRTGKYECPAIITAVQSSLNREGVEGGFIPDLDDADRVHLTVFTAGKPGKRGNAEDFVNPSTEPISENVSGCYQEWNVAHSESGITDTDE